MMQAARDAARETRRPDGTRAPLVIAVTVLTSMSAAALAETGVERPLLDQVLRLADLAQAAGLDGVVASPQETVADPPALRPRLRDRDARHPRRRRGRQGHRRPGADDDARGGGRGGASYLVVGRPIIAAEDPRQAAMAIAADMQRSASQVE